MVNKIKKITCIAIIILIIGCGILPIDKPYIYSQDIDDKECFICNGEGIKPENCRDKKSKQKICIACKKTEKVHCFK